MVNQKKEIRKYYKKLREDMIPEQVEEQSRKICERILSAAEFCRAEWLFAYAPLGNEADVRGVVREAWRQGKRVTFPKVFGEEMVFFEVRDFSGLRPGAFGVMEPPGRPMEAISVFDTEKERCALDLTENGGAHKGGRAWPDKLPSVLMLVPGVAFDRTGRRMGFGKGYYDRYLASWRLADRKHLVTMGVAYDLQVAERIPTEETDVPLDCLATECGIWNFANRL